MTNISILDKEKCTGCGACFNICPVGAITIKENSEGFLYPEIDKEKCTNCGLCTKACAMLNLKYKNKKNPECYAFMASSEERIKSSSGAAFPVLAKEFINNGDYVAGAIWDKEFGVEHIVSNNLEDIEKMRGSKYLQSNTKSCFKEIKEFLNNGKKVLFTGCPCQVAGLKTYLQKDYKNLFCIDIVCHGVPSQKVFKKYLKENFDKNITNINFRSKKAFGWGCGKGIEITDDSNEKQNLPVNSYLNAFLSNILAGTSCKTCPFSQIPRQGDITIGDFWGINKYNKKYNDKKGTSVVLINNSKGKYLLSILKNNNILLEKVPIKYALKHNENIYRPSFFHKDRDKFYNDIDKLSINDNVKTRLNDKCDVMLLYLWSSVNYGAVLNCYGLKCLLEKLGYNTKVINYVPELNRGYEESFSKKFGEKYLNLTNKINKYSDLVKLNENCKNFITGSDQLWNENVMNTHHSNVTETMYLLDFVNSDNRKISYATSFGNNFGLENHNRYINLFKHFLPQFDSVSVREYEGIEYTKELNVEAERLIDSAFFIPKETLNGMAEQYKKDEEYVLYFGLPYFKDCNWDIDIAEKISKKLNVPLKKLIFNHKTPVEEWLSYIKNAKYVISNSYHGLVFSIIFNVPFVQVKHSKSQIRFETLFDILNIKNNSIGQFDELNFDKILKEYNWNEINSNIQKEISKAEDWLKNALEKPVKDKSQYDSLNYLFTQNMLNEEKYKADIKLLANKDNIFKKYYKYKILSKILFGKKRKHYKQKQKEQKELINKIRKFAK